MKTIALACDHGGFDLKNHIKKYLTAKGYTCNDYGTDSPDSVDYPDYAKAACQAVLDGSCECALLFCGTGVGMSMAANKMHGIRACCCSDVFTAQQTRLHNNANALCLGGRVLGPGSAELLVDTFLETGYMGGKHQRRLDMLAEIEKAY